MEKYIRRIRDNFPDNLHVIDNDDNKEWASICKKCIKELKVPKNLLIKPSVGRFGYCSISTCKEIEHRYINFYE